MVYTLTLADGRVVQLRTRRPLRFWKSALMHEAPWGAEFIGAVFARRAA